MEVGFRLGALEDALLIGTPGIFNTDQGSQFTSLAFTQRVLSSGARMSMDGRGRFMDNIFIERLWRSLKYEAVYLHELEDGHHARQVVGSWVDFYNHARPILPCMGTRPRASTSVGGPDLPVGKTTRAASPRGHAQTVIRHSGFPRTFSREKRPRSLLDVVTSSLAARHRGWVRTFGASLV